MSDCCPKCARRRWLLGALSGGLDFRARDPSRFWRLLQLSDTDLIDAIGGRRRAALHESFKQWAPRPADSSQDVESLCRHHDAYPHRLRETTLAPHALSVRGGLRRFTKIFERRTVVAIVGTPRASDYGMETARELAHGLAAAGVGVASGLSEGIAIAAHSGALEASGATFTVMAGGVERCSPAWCRALYRRLLTDGCVTSEAPTGLRLRPWGVLARARTLALLAQLVIVVEAEERPWDLACARIAQELEVPVAAVPGRLSSPVSRGTNLLLMNGARLIREPQDALDLIYGVGALHGSGNKSDPKPETELEPELQRVLALVGAGADTLEKLTSDGGGHDRTLRALVELELRGLLLRGDGGRYVRSCRETRQVGCMTPKSPAPERTVR